MRDFIFDVKVPRPYRHFCGRDAEMEKLHELLCSKGKVFVQGIAGIGKSELLSLQNLGIDIMDMISNLQ